MRFNRTIAFAFVIALVAQAQDGRGPGGAGQEGFGQGPGRGRFPGPNAGFTTLDVNGDGTLDAGEIESAPRSLARLDKNSDGRIDSDEVRMAIPQGRGRGGPGGGRGPEGAGRTDTSVAEETVKTLMAFDANGDASCPDRSCPSGFRGSSTAVTKTRMGP